MRLVTLSPSVPASGELLTMNDIDTVGGSIGCAFKGASTERIAEGIGDGALGKAGNGDNVAGFGFLQRRALDAAESDDLGDPPGLDQLAVAAQDLDGLVRLDGAGVMRPVMMRPR